MSRQPEADAPRSIVLHIRVTPTERERIETLKQPGENLSQCARRLLLGTTDG